MRVEHESQAVRAPKSHRPHRARIAFSALAVTTAMLLSACAPTAPAPPPTASAHTFGYPLTIDNCGTDITINAAPQRIVTIKSTTFELLLALGVGDRIVGSSYADGPVPDEYADAAAEIPVLSDKLPSQEATLALSPDFIFGGWESNFSAEGVGERTTLETLGITSYVAPAACTAAEYRPNPLTFDDVFAGFTQVGAIFDAAEAADALIAEQRAQLADITPNTDGLTAAWYSSGRDKPFVGAGIGAPQLIMETAGLTNVFADVEESWISTSWEAVVAADPDVLVLVNSPGNTAESKIQRLKENPATATLTAVKNERFVILEFPATEAGVRTVSAVSSVVEQLAE